MISFPGKIIQALSITFFNSRTLPGQLCLHKAVIASGVNIGFCVSSTLRLFKSVFCRLGISVLLSAKEGTLIGSTVYEGNHLALTVWGDDVTTDEKDGLVEGERIIFRLWSSATSTEQILDIKWEEGSGIYSTDGISVAGQVILGNELTSERQLVKITDVLGREINGDEKDIMILHIYNDGSIERIFIKE